MITLNINHQKVNTELDEDMPLLWLLREELNLTGTKYGCGIGQCGACTVHLNGNAVRACSTPIGAIGEGKVTTIEGEQSKHLNALKQAWKDHNVPQCGYCQSGQIMSAAALLEQNQSPSDSQIEQAMSGNICRCGTYPRIKQGIKDAAAKFAVNVGNTTNTSKQ